VATVINSDELAHLDGGFVPMGVESTFLSDVFSMMETLAPFFEMVGRLNKPSIPICAGNKMFVMT